MGDNCNSFKSGSGFQSRFYGNKHQYSESFSKVTIRKHWGQENSLEQIWNPLQKTRSLDIEQKLKNKHNTA